MLPRLRLSAITAGTLLLSVLAGASPSANATTPTTLLGSYSGSAAMQAWQGKSDAVSLLFAGWSDDPAAMEAGMLADWNKHSVPLLAWYLMGDNNQGVTVGNQLIASGAEDSHIQPYITMFKHFLSGPDGVYGNADDRRVFLRIDPEANGDWNSFSPAFRKTNPDGSRGAWPSLTVYNQNVASFKAMWAHMHDLFAGQGITSADLTWMFSISATDTAYPHASHIAEAIYPGDAYVDWIGLDGYNFGSTSGAGWQSPDDVFDKMVGRMTQLAPNKPIGASEVGCTTSGKTPADKDAWITSYFSWLQGSAVGSKFRMTAWWNADETTASGAFHDITVYGGSTNTGWQDPATGAWVYPAYKSGVSGDATLVGPDTANPRLITDSQFAGTG